MAQITKLPPSYVVDIIFRQFSQKKGSGSESRSLHAFPRTIDLPAVFIWYVRKVI